MYLFSRETLAFYPATEIQIYLNAGTLPEDVIEVSCDVRDTFNAQPPEGMNLGVDNAGMPTWVKKTLAESMANANFIRVTKIDSANSFMNAKQWPGKAALGRLKNEELAEYNKWLDYLDALDNVDTSIGPDIEWPAEPR